MSWKDDFLKSISARNILVIGDLMLDKYLWGKVTRISPEAPVPILNLERSHSRLGGAANVALNLRSLGARVSLIGVIGDDVNGENIISLLDESQIARTYVMNVTGIPTTTKTRVIAGHQHVLRVDDEKFLRLAETQEEKFIGNIQRAIENDSPDAIILQDYNKGVFSPGIIRKVLDLSKESGIPVAVDPKKDNFEAYSGATIFKPNLPELSGQFVSPVKPEKVSLEEAVGRLRKTMDIDICCVTLSEHGIYISSKDGSAIYPTAPRNVVDVCGAGDAVISVLTLAYLDGLNDGNAAELANRAGGAVCGVVGVSPVTYSMLQKELSVESFL